MPRELAELTLNFYRRNYIEGLFLSSGVLRDPDYTCEQMIETLRLLREEGLQGHVFREGVLIPYGTKYTQKTSRPLDEGRDVV